MEGILKVTPEKLMEAADKFSTAESNIRSITNEMSAIVDGFKNIWQGEAATSYANRFDSLKDDMQRMYSMIREHSSDLIEMANEYKQAEEESINASASLATEAVS